jgi:hypothetical protein
LNKVNKEDRFIYLFRQKTQYSHEAKPLMRRKRGAVPPYALTSPKSYIHVRLSLGRLCSSRQAQWGFKKKSTVLFSFVKEKVKIKSKVIGPGLRRGDSLFMRKPGCSAA